MAEANEQIELSELIKVLERIGNGEMTVAQARGITPQELEAVYALAYDYYRTGRIDEAETIFRFLTMFDHLNEKYWLGLGAIFQVKKQFDRAVKIYAYVAATLDLKNVSASYYAAECYLALGDLANARSAVEHVKRYADVATETGRTLKAKALKLEKQLDAKSAK